MKRVKMGITDNATRSRPGTPTTGYARFFTPGSAKATSSTQLPSSTTASSVAMTKDTPATTTTNPSAMSTPQHSRPNTAPKQPSFFKHPTRARARSIIMMGNKPVAVSMRSDKDKDQPELVVIPKPPPKPVVPPKTIRVFAPNEDRKGILLSIGRAREIQEEADRIFQANEMQKKTFAEWRLQATAQLPSQAGGPTIESIADALNAAPALQKEKDPRAMHRAIKRLSIESQENQPFKLPKRRSTVDYTRVRDVRYSKSESRSEASHVTVDMYMDEEEAAALREYQRKQAGIDFKKKIQTLKELSHHLSYKIEVRRQLVQKATGQAVLDAEDIPIKEHILYLVEHMGNVFHDIGNFFVIWEKQIREINGKFGTVTATYFVWTRKMIALEILAFILINICIIIPQVVEDNTVNEGPERKMKQPRPRFDVRDLFHGEGYLHHSYLYYTGYHSDPYYDSPNPFENPAFRFVFCILALFIILTYFIFSRLTRYYQTNRMESTVSGVANMETFKCVMCAWDFSCRDEKGKIYMHQTIQREMRIIARKSAAPDTALIQIEVERKKVLAFAVKHLGLVWAPRAIHVIGNLLILVIYVILGLILYYLCKVKLHYYLQCVELRDDPNWHAEPLHDELLCPNGDDYLRIWILCLPSFFASIMSLLLTKLILIVGDTETWNTPNVKIYATMIRAGIFYLTNILVFYTFWLKAKPELNAKGFVAETIFGKELYRMVVIQGVIEVTMNLGVRGLWHLLRRKSSSYKLPNFRTEYCCLGMFFTFGVSRIGTLFCPPLSFFVTIRLIIDFYQNKFTLYHLSTRDLHAAHVSQIYGPFLLTFFVLCYLITAFLNVFYLTDTIPSNYNGPFQHYNGSYVEVLDDLFESNRKTRWLSHLVNGGFLTTWLAILIGLTYFCRQWAHAYNSVLKNLNTLIHMERADRDLLLRAIFEIGKFTTMTGGGVDDQDNARAEQKIRRAGEFLEKEGAPTEMDDFDDDHIDALLHHVRRRKTLNADGHVALTAASRKNTFANAASLVAKIVDARKQAFMWTSYVRDRQTSVPESEANQQPDPPESSGPPPVKPAAPPKDFSNPYAKMNQQTKSTKINPSKQAMGALDKKKGQIHANKPRK